MTPAPTSISLRAVARALTFVTASTLASTSPAQNYGAAVQQGMANLDAIINQAQQQVNVAVQQRMNDPQVRASYAEYVQRMRMSGQPVMDFPTYTYNWIYTRGFSADGTAHARANERNIANNEMAAAQRLRQAEAERGQAQQQQRDAYFRNQQETGRGLMGQSTFTAPNGMQMVLPHTWQPNTTQVYQNNTYYIDLTGRYYVRGTDGWWYPLQR
ncbi:MAG TPA: hypothetical protein VNE58_12085 [Casimicrobiaceae bacterium]|nr:hypothetical protein [Casimicrobiaceae bacterium]